MKRYLGSADRLKNPIAQEEMQRFHDVVGFFRKYVNKIRSALGPDRGAGLSGVRA
jgi:hypothetical protein